MLKRFAKQIVSSKKAVRGNYTVTYPAVCSTPFLKGLTEHALKLYEKKTDIKKFTKLALSDPENKDYEPRVKEILSKEDDDLFDLADNERFLKDLGL